MTTPPPAAGGGWLGRLASSRAAGAGLRAAAPEEAGASAASASPSPAVPSAAPSPEAQARAAAAKAYIENMYRERDRATAARLERRRSVETEALMGSARTPAAARAAFAGRTARRA